MTDRELMQQALVALANYGSHASDCDYLMLLASMPPQRKPCSCGLAANIQALRDRLAQPQEPDWSAAGFGKPPQPDLAKVGEVGVWGEQEPVCWVYPGFFDDLSEVHCGTAYRLPGFERIPLYTAPQYKENNDDKS